MPSEYLTSGEYGTYGVPSATAEQVQQASTLIDGYLQRPEGLVWSPDANGQPAWMTALDPSFTLNAPGAIAAGANVSVPVTGPVGSVQVGDVLIVDKATQGSEEACVVAETAADSVTLETVQFAHNAGVDLDAGLVILEERAMPKARPKTRVSRWPAVRLLGGQGRYAYARRGQVPQFNMEDFNLLSTMTTYGGPPTWERFSVQTAELTMNGEVWVPAGILLAYYTHVRLQYVAGFQASTLPPEIKQACAKIVTHAQQYGLGDGVRSYKAGDTAIQRFAASAMDADTKALLSKYQARTFV